MSYRLVALDLDDTLLDENSKISERNRRAVAEAIDKGVRVTLATGRMLRSTAAYARELGIELPLITYHGALVKRLNHSQSCYYQPLEYQMAREVLEEAQKKGHHVNLYLDDRLLVKEHNRFTRFYATISSVQIEAVGDLVKVIEEFKKGPPKLTVIDEEEAMEELISILEERYRESINLMLSRPFFLEITHPQATKGRALKMLAEEWGIKRAEVMAVGDSFNDLDMIQYAGMGVAVENARPQVKSAADHITLSHQEDGVAEVLEKYVLNHQYR